MIHILSHFINYLILVSCLSHGYSLIDISSYDASSSLENDWDSNLYGKPICVSIPSNMSLCKNINYNQMKIPNLIGHDTIEEVVYQSSVWMPLLQVNCHRDTQLFLCSLFAPVCVDQQSQTFIYPCRSLCESVKQSCEGPMLSYNYPWPSMFNCSKFPEDNGLCIQTSNRMMMEQTTHEIPTQPREEYVPVTTPTPKTRLIVTTSTVKPVNQNINVKPYDSSRYRMYENLFIDNTCYACDEDSMSLEEIVYGYCNSDIVLRGRIQSIKISRLDTKLPLRRFKNVALQNKLNMNKTRSLLINVDRRDRKFLKGYRLINAAGWSSFLNENQFSSDDEDSYDYDNIANSINKELNIYLMSNLHLAEANLNNDVVLRKAIQSREPNLANRSKHARNRTASMQARWNRDSLHRRFTAGQKSRPNNHCICEKMRKGMRRMNTKFLLMANLLNSKNLHLNKNNRFNSFRRNKRELYSNRNEFSSSFDLNANSTIKIIRSNGGEQEIVKNSNHRRHDGQNARKMTIKKYRELKSGDEQLVRTIESDKNNQVQLIYLTNFVQWNQARAFIDYLDNDSINKQGMCKNIKKTVNRINRAFNSLL